MRNIRKILSGTRQSLGQGQTVMRYLPNEWTEQISPFLMLDHFGPVHVDTRHPFYVPPHPHKGFEPVTIVLKGEVLHHDSAGNTGHLKAGDIQWMTAGKGIVHSEGAPEAFLKQGGEVEIIQLWINLPRVLKQHEARYQDIRSEQFPVIEAGEGQHQLLAGSYNGSASPVELLHPVLLMRSVLDRGQTSRVNIPADYNVCVFVLEGIIHSDGFEIPANHLIWYNNAGEGIELKAESPSRYLVLAGESIHEPVATYGPFVMNTKTELIHALEEYREGKMGVLEK